ncbi:MAG: hypothetical protein JNG88_00550 [Phycisphaerales bacterium]|nr:hypothetical protein [Phycisphaerales bacterium]
MQQYDELKRMVDDVGEDVLKALGGNKAAGTRVRKTMQEIKNLAQSIRKRLLDLRGPEDTPPAQPQ